jgi:hypothetical protein
VIRKDYIERMIEQLVEAIARLLQLGQAGQHGEALAVVRTTCLEVFGLEYEVLVGVDPTSAAGILGSSLKTRRFAELVRAEAEVLDAAGETSLASRRRDFAAALEKTLG